MRYLVDFFRNRKAYKLLKKSPLFDPEYYLLTYQDVRHADVDPLKHFVIHGAADKRNPSEQFDTAYYLEKYPDVLKSRLNPLYHFVRYGQAEDRQPIRQKPVAEFRQSSSVEHGLRIMNASIECRLNNLSDYLRKISDYNRKRKQRLTKCKIVVYTAIANNYDSLKLPEVLDADIDYVVFTNNKLPDTGIWQARPLPTGHGDATRNCRYVKTHPHVLLPDYEIAIWIDSNIMLVDSINSDISRFMESGKLVGAMPHPYRTNIYDELEACRSMSKDSSDLMQKQIDYYRSQNFVHNDLIESNFMMFDLSHKLTHMFLDTWWEQIKQFSRRDQLSLNYSLSFNKVEWHRITKFPNSARNHPSLAYVHHDGGKSSAFDFLGKVVKYLKSRRVDVVIPVYNALEDVKKCLESLEIYQDGFEVRVIIVNDDSDVKTSAYLRHFCTVKHGFVLLENPQNQGYTKTVNNGLRISDAPYVIALNSDTVVTSGWLSGLHACITSDPKIGIAGPLSNAASWQTVPELMDADGFKVNQLPEGMSPDDFAGLVKSLESKNYPRVNVINGFCFMIRREVIDRIGFMDEENFPVGYGEENDFCIRAANAGFELAIADNSYVFHAKSKSFGHDTRKTLSQQGQEALVRVHGKRKVQNLTKNLRHHPVLDKVRADLLVALTDYHKKTSCKPSLAVLVPELTGSGTLAGSAYVRLVEPYVNSGLFKKEHIDIHKTQKLPAIGSAQYVIFQRSLSYFKYDDLLEWLPRWRQAGGRIVYDVDDDLFDYEGFSARTGSSYAQFESMLAKISLVLLHSETVTVSTQALKDKLANKTLNVVLQPNFLNIKSWTRLNQAVRCSDKKPVVIGYCGTPTHNQDLSLVTTAIKRLEQEFGSNIKVEVIGAFESQPVLFGTKVPIQSKSTYPNFIKWLQGAVEWDIGLIPLVEDTFNKSKSHIKFLEYSALGVANVCSQGATYSTIAKNRKNSLVVENTEEHWYQALKELILDADLRCRLAKEARREVLENFTVQSNSDCYKSVIPIV